MKILLPHLQCGRTGLVPGELSLNSLDPSTKGADVRWSIRGGRWLGYTCGGLVGARFWTEREGGQTALRLLRERLQSWCCLRFAWVSWNIGPASATSKEKKTLLGQGGLLGGKSVITALNSVSSREKKTLLEGRGG